MTLAQSSSRDPGISAKGRQATALPILIYRDRLLPYSETFIPAQVEAMTRYQGYYVGVSRQATQQPLPQERVCLMEEQVAWPALSKTAFRMGGHVSRAILQNLRARSPRLIHAHFGPDGIFAGHLARRLNIPLIVTFHGYDAGLSLTADQMRAGQNLGTQLHQLLYHRGTFYQRCYVEQRAQLFSRANCIIAVSQYIRERLLEQGCPDEKIKVHYIGIDRSQFEPNHSLKREPVILFVGRLVEKKGCGSLLQAMGQLQDQHRGVRVVIIGDGPLRNQLEQQAQRLNCPAEFLGSQPRDVVQQWMNRARLFCVPSQQTSKQDIEGLGMVFAEAQAMGLPVVSFASGGVPEVVRHGQTGLLAPEKNVDALAQALHQLLSDKEQWQQMAIAGQRHIAENFSLANNTPKLEAIYDQILATQEQASA